MSAVGILLLSGISAVALFALVFRQTLLLRVTAVLLLTASALLYLFALLGPLPRSAITIRSNQGTVSEDFKDGVYALSAVYRPMMPLIIVPLFGLALLAVIGRKNKNG